jgi:hypothetical protein
MPDMSPQAVLLRADRGGWYSGAIVPPMEGFMNLAVQVRAGAGWRTARLTVCDVDDAYAMHLLL